jgi:hypothetical protein
MSMLERSKMAEYNSRGGDFMSPERELKARVLLEYQETENEVGALEVEARRIGERISSFGELMKTQPTEKIFRKGQPHHGVATEYLSEKVLQTMKEWEKCFEVADNLRHAYSRLNDLKLQKERLGLR